VPHFSRFSRSGALRRIVPPLNYPLRCPLPCSPLLEKRREVGHPLLFSLQTVQRRTLYFPPRCRPPAHDGDKFLGCAGKAVWAGAKSAVPLPPTAPSDRGGAVVDMAKKVGEFTEKHAPMIAAAAATTFRALGTSGPEIAAGLELFGKGASKFAVAASVGLVIYNTGASYKEQADAGECAAQ
jgi:hypothetical protein